MIDFDDIYFVIWLSWRGAPTSLSRFRRGGEIVKAYIDVQCQPHDEITSDGNLR